MLWPHGHCGLQRYLVYKSPDLVSVEQHNLWIKVLIKTILSAINEISQLSRLSLNICVHLRSYLSKSCYKLFPSGFRQVSLNRDKQSFINSYKKVTTYSVVIWNEKTSYMKYYHLCISLKHWEFRAEDLFFYFFYVFQNENEKVRII